MKKRGDQIDHLLRLIKNKGMCSTFNDSPKFCYEYCLIRSKIPLGDCNYNIAYEKAVELFLEDKDFEDFEEDLMEYLL